MKRMIVKNLGQIASADVEFGDLTFLVGQQASGKSIFLQQLKLALDKHDIYSTIKRAGFLWSKDAGEMAQVYFGEGMQGLFNADTSVVIDDKTFVITDPKRGRGKVVERAFYIPAQRVLSTHNGWPRSFTDFEPRDPYVLKKFSEHLRLLMEAGLGSGKKSDSLFPQTGRMEKELRELINDSIYYGAKIQLDKSHPRRRLVLNINGISLPFMTWSAGQKEFSPMLLGLYWLMPVARISKKHNIEYVIIEEPEMGLHPRAIQSIMIVFFELVRRGYKLIVSTHSTTILELLWAWKVIARLPDSTNALLELFGLQPNTRLMNIFTALKEKSIETYYFERTRKGVVTKNISTLDPFSDDKAVSDWGGLTEFSTMAADIIAQYQQ